MYVSASLSGSLNLLDMSIGAEDPPACNVWFAIEPTAIGDWFGSVTSCDCTGKVTGSGDVVKSNASIGVSGTSGIGTAAISFS